MTEYVCNKCGYGGPVHTGHQRPNGTGECGYSAVPVPPAAPGQCKHISECADQIACFGPTPGCRRAYGVGGVEIDRDTDGELLIDWSPGKGRMLTMTLRADGRLSYAFTWDGERVHGTAQMPVGVTAGLLAKRETRPADPSESEVKIARREGYDEGWNDCLSALGMEVPRG